jgi:hypothetical protein
MRLMWRELNWFTLSFGEWVVRDWRAIAPSQALLSQAAFKAGLWLP